VVTPAVQPARYGGNYMHNYHLAPAPSSTPWAPAWAPDGRAVAVAMAGSIWRVDIADGAAEELTASATYHSQPTWSPDGRWIVYTAEDASRSVHLEALDLQSGAVTALTSGAAVHADPGLSPDGGRLVYTASLPNGFFTVFVQTFHDGALVGAPVPVTADGTLGRDRPYFTAQDLHITPTWLPNGRELLVVSNRGVALGSGAIVRLPAEAQALARATPVVSEQTLHHARPDVSPDGARLAYVSAQGGRAPWHTLMVASADGTAAQPLTSEADAFTPAWSPDSASIAFVSNVSGVPQLALADVRSRAVRHIVVGRRQRKRPVGTLALRIVERGAASPVAARVHLTAADGRASAPPTAYARVSWAGDRVFHSDGIETFEVPAGPVTLDVVRGLEVAPAHVVSTIAAGETRELTVALDRVADLAATGWCSGSTGAHVHGAGLQRYGQEVLLAQARAEDLDVVNNAVAHRDPRLAEREFFRWGDTAHPASTADRLLVLGQEYRPPFHGHVAVFGDPTPLAGLFDVTIGYEGNPPLTLAPSNTAVLRAAKARGAVTSYVHAFSGETDPMQAGLGPGKAFAVDAALGPADAWWAGVERGHAFASTGPLVALTVNGALSGDEVRLDVAGTVTVAGSVTSITPLQRVILVVNGEEVAEIPLADNRRSTTFSRSLPVTRSSWVHLRAEGVPADRFPLDALYAQAFTNPTWVTVGSRPVRDGASAGYRIRWIDTMQLMADAWPGWTSATEKAAVFSDFEVCYFGAPVRMNEWVLVTMKGGKRAKFTHLATTVKGRLDVGEEMRNGRVACPHRLEADVAEAEGGR